MPDIDMPKRAKGVSQAMRGRPVIGEELDRMIAKVPSVRKREPEKWRQLLRGLNLSGRRLSEAHALSWDDEAPINVCTSGKYPALRIRAEAEKAHRDRLLPIAPEFAEFLLAYQNVTGTGWCSASRARMGCRSARSGRAGISRPSARRPALSPTKRRTGRQRLTT